MSEFESKPLSEADLTQPPAPNTVRVVFKPENRVCEFEFDKLPYDGHGLPQSFLDVAENFGVFLDHACGGVSACTTCHLHILKGEQGLSEAEDLELDRLEQAPGLQLNSRLGCQCVIEKPGDYIVEIPAWNKNYVQEGKPVAGVNK